jgi:shikimate kinase
MNIALIGYRGTGKTTAARHLALRLGREWIDADVEVEWRAGKSIAAIFAEEGETAFRDLESLVLAELLNRDDLVLAAGGGAVLREPNRRRLAERARVVWLRAEPATILERTAADLTTAARRPGLTTPGGEREVVTMLAERTPLYEQCADLNVHTDNKTPADVAAEIHERLISLYSPEFP